MDHALCYARDIAVSKTGKNLCPQRAYTLAWTWSDYASFIIIKGLVFICLKTMGAFEVVKIGEGQSWICILEITTLRAAWRMPGAGQSRSQETREVGARKDVILLLDSAGGWK